MIAAPDLRNFLIVSSVPLRPKLDGLLARVPIVDRWRVAQAPVPSTRRMLAGELALTIAAAFTRAAIYINIPSSQHAFSSTIALSSPSGSRPTSR